MLQVTVAARHFIRQRLVFGRQAFNRVRDPAVDKTQPIVRIVALRLVGEPVTMQRAVKQNMRAERRWVERVDFQNVIYAPGALLGLIHFRQFAGRVRLLNHLDPRHITSPSSLPARAGTNPLRATA